MVELLFAGCVVKVWSSVYHEVVFPNGGIVPALYGFTDADRATAREAGYADDDASVALMHFEHDLSHCYLADLNGLPYSPVLYRVAGGPDVDPHARACEEGAVLAFQRVLNQLHSAWGSTAFRQTYNREAVLAQLEPAIIGWQA